jgi:TPR repeat protein
MWYRRAADQGYPPAQANLGLMHMHGSGVPPDWNEAVEWFRLAAAQGNYAARENLRMLEIQSSAGS